LADGTVILKIFFQQLKEHPMSNRLFSFINPNSDIMVVPQEEGGTADDNYFGSIGDATMRHVQSLNGYGRQMWEGLIHMRSGAMFRMFPNPKDHDQDPYKLKGKDLTNYLEVYKAEVKRNTGHDLSEAELICAQEAIEEEQARRERSQDVYEKNEVIPYHEWQNNPNMWKHVDIPSTPRERFAYVGNCTQNFYDSFPEGHPDSTAINQCLTILNRPFPKEIDKGYHKFVCDWLNNRKMKAYTRLHLKHLALRLYESIEDPDDMAQKCLEGIDRSWARERLNEAAGRMMRQEMTKLMLHKEKEWEKLHKQGMSVFGSIKTFGRVLFEDFRGKMNSWHWSRYRAAKRKYAPRVMLQGVDLNRCSRTKLLAIFGGDSQRSNQFWIERPFQTLEEAHAKKLMKPQCFADDAATEAIALFLEKHGKIAMDKLSPAHMAEVCKVMLDMQRQKKGGLDNDQWGSMWRYYKILKHDVLAAKKQADKKAQEVYSEGREEDKAYFGSGAQL